MKSDLCLLVFTDLDGTLIDHKTYAWEPARPALEQLARIGAGVVMASSKTAAEIGPLRVETGLDVWPAIVENGAGILPAYHSETGTTAQYSDLRDIIDCMPTNLRAQFSGFGDMSTADIMHVTGLSCEAAQLAKARDFSEPGIWHGTETDKGAFLAALAEHGVTGRKGGRFLTLSFGHDKAHRMKSIIAELAPRKTVALGDAPNDVEMLQAADYGIIVSNPNGPQLPKQDGETQGRITRTKDAGPTGWNAAILDLLKRLDLHKD
jgi:mannosyl-3-phosphoglycerate phosphatase